jgi:PPOX class probable FMN-dependent enzyme
MELPRPFSDVVTSEEPLRAVLGYPSERSLGKQLAKLDQHCRAFIAASPFLVIGTSDAAGRCDASPKGDHPGFVHVLDDHHLAIPDRLGNKRLDGMRNVLANPHVGLIFFIPGRDDTLRVNGRAWVIRDEPILERMAVGGKRPPFALGVQVEEAFMHCARAFMRAALWEAAQQPPAASVPSMPEMLWDQLPQRPPFGSAEEFVRDYRERLRELY